MSVIIPCYNELDSIDLLYKKSLYITKNYDVEIIFVDNGSNDGTSKKFQSLISTKKIKFSTIQTNKGYGYGIKKSIDLCNGLYVGWTHADLQTDIFDIIRGIKYYNKNSIFVKGRRIKRGFYETEILEIAKNPNDFDDYKITDLFYNELEKLILEEPSFYFWTHNRFKLRKSSS